MATTNTNETVQQELDRLRTENERLKEKAIRKVSCKIGEKKNLCIYGMQKFPYSFYLSQWDRLMQELPAIQAFVEAHRSEFAVKE